MKRSVIATAVAAVLAAPAIAQAVTDQEMNEVRAVVDALAKRIERLEAENADLKQKNDRLEATTEYLRDNASATRKTIAQEVPKLEKVDALEKSAKAAEWASKVSWKGDLRYRHENVDAEESVADQTRHRVRARFGLTAKVNDSISATVQLATGGGNNDPRSTNQTLGSGFDRKGVAIDLAYVDWKAMSGLNVQLGKMPLPWQRVGSFFWDNDVTPEGGAVKFAGGPFFGSAFGYWLSERSTAADASLIGGQLGLKGDLGGMKLTGAVGYFDVGAVQGQVTATPSGCATAFNNAFFGGAQGNTTVTLAGCPRLLNDFNMIHVLGQAELKLGSLPLVVFADFIQNQEADDLDTGYAAGFTLGKAGEPWTWELGYAYQTTEKDAAFGQFVDSDFAGGLTDAEGSVLRIGLAPAKNWTLNGTYFLNKRFVDVGTERDYDRLQIDMNYKF